ncbi:B3 domain-containing protein Os01g0234100-like isoform X2 [Syzygium oleosum]|uniref:B3 domain-containing protein Os01g0234100-like isoform X2 n=1 Tax=Syzygium oleosum TaxID=219896 RepID=UPI0024BB78E8|nr:B3 domain-containing protein Os01g0234100-like isoform X2 [Syzygium oleosum]
MAKPKSQKRKRAKEDDYCSAVAADAMERAKEVQSSLSLQFPSFVKRMLPSHVTRVFWMGLPKQFCDSHLPKEDVTIKLEDESGEVYETKYLFAKTGLSGGWRGFSIAHSIMEGDAVVFQLVMPTQFKVYIVRSSNFSEVDGALGLINLGPCSRRVNPEHTKSSEEEDDDTYWVPLAKELTPENIHEDGFKIWNTDCKSVADHPKTDSNDRVSNGLHGIQFSESVIDFKDVTSIENFSIITKGLVIDSELSEHLRAKYYELCRCQKTFLHTCLLEGLNYKLAAGIISETVNIADAIRASRITTSIEDFDVWATTLKAFEDLGMDVGFLRARLGRLISLALTSRKCEEVKGERACAAEKRSRLEAELTETKGAISRLHAEIETTGNDSYGLEMAFQQVASAPW